MVCAEPNREPQLIPLHTRSCYSFGFGVTPIEKLVDRSVAVGLDSLGLTDIDNLCGQVVFHKLARDRGLHPVTGVELDFGGNETPAGRLVLLARNREGYANLCEIVSRRQCGEKRHASTLDANGCAGLFLMTDSVEIADSLIDKGLEPASMRLLLVRPGPLTSESRIRSAARRMSIPLLADPDIVFLDPGHHVLHRLSAAIRENALLSDTRRQNRLVASKERYFAGPRRWRSIFSDVPDAIEETRKVAGQCELDLTRNRTVFPGIRLPGTQTVHSHLRNRCLRGIRKRHGKISRVASSRLDSELQTIRKLGFSEYFVIVADIVAEARRREISTITRGSGAGSLVAWALEITSVDPLAYGLYFERFLHEGREGDLPDIDIDLCWIRRDEVIRAVYEVYGEDRVAMVSSHNTFQPRSALRETLKSFGVGPAEVNRYSRSIACARSGSGASLAEVIRNLPFSLRPPVHEEPFRSAIPLAQQLTGLPRNLSVHCGGIVIADGPIRRYAPLQQASKGVIITQYDKDSVKKVGLVKIDLLGNRCLSEIDEAVAWIGKGGTSLKPEEIPDGDPATIKLLRDGATIGCFQMESPAMRGLLRKIRPGGIRDCITALALVRPAAAAGGAKDSFIRRRKGEEAIPYHHPVLREILEESLGTILYEEDVMRIVSAAAGVSLVEGELLRCALKKCRDREDLKDLENRFLARAIRRDIPPTVALDIWNDLRRFAGYCFSKAHACSYGFLAWQSAYLKANYPVEFSCALLNHHAGMYDKRAIAAEILRLGIEFLGPCVNHSAAVFSIEPGGENKPKESKKIRASLRQVKGLCSASLEKIIAGRPYRSLVDFIRRTTIPQREIESLILTGAFDYVCEGANHPQLLWELESSYSRESGRGDPGLLPAAADTVEYPPLAHYSPWKRLCNELEYLGMNIFTHPLSLCRKQLEDQCRKKKRSLIRTDDACRLRSDRKVFVAGLITATRRVRTARGDPMLFVTLEDEAGLLEATLFPKAYRRLGSLLGELGPYLFEGTVESEHGVESLDISGIERLDGSAMAQAPGDNGQER